MKNPPPSAARPASRLPWPTIAVVSLVANFLLLAWALRVARTPAPAVPPAAPPPPTAPVAAKLPPRPAALAPFAALGSFMAENNRIADLAWTAEQFAAFQDGFRASYEGRGLPLDEDAKKLRDDISKRVQAMLAAEQPNPIEEYFRALREKEGVQKAASGLHYRLTESGSGPNAKPTDTVVLSFSARLPDGTALPQLSRARTRLAVRDLLPGLAEGVQLLNVGAKALVYLPPALAFTEDNWPADVPRGAPLAFFVELHEIQAPAKRAK